MRRFAARSLQARLVLRLTLVYVVASAIAALALIYRVHDTADTLNKRKLSLRAAELSAALALDATGKLRLDLPKTIAAAYASSRSGDAFAIRNARGELIAASSASFGERVAGWPIASGQADFFKRRNSGAHPVCYYGMSIVRDSAAGPLSVTVASVSEADSLMDSLLSEFVQDVAWVIPVVMFLTIGTAILAIRSGLKPIERAARMAADIGPHTTGARLPEKNLPSEVAPLVAAVNRALERLERGFAIQREFTAHAAHELRTPLAILTAALEMMNGNGELARVREDASRMNRLIEQLLGVARLDAVALDVSATVDLNEVAVSVVAAMAPWAIARLRTLALAGETQPVHIKGNAHAVSDAIRNLIENAVAYSPANEAVLIRVARDGRISVADRGPGVSPADRPHIFDRFWRGNGAPNGGAGLGLAIVHEIMKAHGGAVRIEDAPGRGAVFQLEFPLA